MTIPWFGCDSASSAMGTGWSWLPSDDSSFGAACSDSEKKLKQ